MNKEQRKIYADFDRRLVELLTEGKTDEDFFQRLCWALQRVSNEISHFTES